MQKGILFVAPPPQKIEIVQMNAVYVMMNSVLWFDRLGDGSGAPEVVTLPVKPRWAGVNISR